MRGFSLTTHFFSAKAVYSLYNKLIAALKMLIDVLNKLKAVLSKLIDVLSNLKAAPQLLYTTKRGFLRRVNGLNRG